MTWYALLIGAVAFERLIEVRVAERNRAVSKTHGGVEFGAGHYPVMVALHIGLLVGCLAEPIMLHRNFIPALGWPMFGVVLAAQALRWWCITTGPYRLVPHPNYVAVIAEGVALPLVHTAWVTALVFSILNAGLLSARVKVENAALAGLR